MSGYLLDTNVISELRKKSRADSTVLAWHGCAAGASLFLSVITVAELDLGIGMLARRDEASAAHLQKWRDDVCRAYRQHGRLLDVTEAVGKAWADLMCIRTIPAIDGLIAATAVVHGLTLATRNEADFAGLPLRMENPWEC